MSPQKIFVGIPVLNRIDLLERCLDRIDHPADVLIVNNDTVYPKIDARLTRLADKRGAEVWRPDRNLGVAASWNLILRTGMGRGHELVFIGPIPEAPSGSATGTARGAGGSATGNTVCLK